MRQGMSMWPKANSTFTTQAGGRSVRSEARQPGACHRNGVRAARRVQCCDRCGRECLCGRRPTLHLRRKRAADRSDRRLDSLEHVTATEFAPRGGSSVVTDAAGNVYVAEGQLYIYDASGRQIGVVEIPERPASLAFGGADKKTLFIGARGSLFSLQAAAAGR